MTHLKQVMEQKRLHIPRDRELIVEMNAEIAQLTQAGKTKSIIDPGPITTSSGP